jgi:hypothetical protein
MRLVSNYGHLSLRDVEVIRADTSKAASMWAEGDMYGPRVQFYEAIDHAGWLVSESSRWLDDARRHALLQGMAEWKRWSRWTVDTGPRDTEDQFTLKIASDRENPALKDAIRPMLAKRLDKTAQILGLDESGEELADRLLAAQFVETYLRPRP